MSAGVHNRVVHSRFHTRTAVVLPGTGSDARFAADAFSAAFDSVGLTTVAVEPDPTAVVESYLSALGGQWTAVVDLATAGQLDELFPNEGK